MIDILYPYQLSNAQDLASREFGADLSEVGTGKTLTAFGTMHLAGARAMLVVIPKSVVGGWEGKFKRFWPEVETFRPNGTSKMARSEAIRAFRESLAARKALLFTYDQIRMDVYELHDINFDCIYADEVHRIGNPLTRTYKAMMVLKSKRRYGATATPLRSSPLQAFGIFNWLKPGILGKNYWHFQFRYTVKTKNGWLLGFQNLDELAVRIRPFYVATTMVEAGRNLPPLVEEDVLFTLQGKQLSLYEKLKKEMMLSIEAAEINKIDNPTNIHNSVVKLGKLQELTDHMEMLGEGTESGKLDLLKEHISDRISGDNKAIVFTHFSRMAYILQRELAEYNPAMIIGDTKDRDAEILKLDHDPNCKVMIISTAGNEGIDLQRANILYMYDVPLGSYGSLVQTIGRIKRDGQERPMVVYYLQAAKTVDIGLKNLLLKKKDMSEKLFSSMADIKEVVYDV